MLQSSLARIRTNVSEALLCLVRGDVVPGQKVSSTVSCVSLAILARAKEFTLLSIEAAESWPDEVQVHVR